MGLFEVLQTEPRYEARTALHRALRDRAWIWGVYDTLGPFQALNKHKTTLDPWISEAHHRVKQYPSCALLLPGHHIPLFYIVPR